MTQHTKTPWQLRVGGTDGAVIYDDDGTIANVPYDLPEWGGNAAHIVHCVNLHDELVRCLGNMTNLYVELKKYDTPSSHEAKSVLAKACAQQPDTKGEE